MAAELDLAGVYRQMLRIREFEERVKATFTEHPGVIRGHTHPADGSYLRAPVKQVTALDATVPYSEPMEAYLLPDEPKIVAAALSVTEGGN